MRDEIKKSLLSYGIYPEAKVEYLNPRCKVKIKDKVYVASFIGVFQYSDVLDASPILGGHPGGVVSYPVAVVRIGDSLKQVKMQNITFEEETI